MIKNALAINWHMVPCKLTYILYGGILGLHLPFINPFFRSIGLSVENAGFINGIRYVSSSLSGPVWGILANYTGRRRLIMILIGLGAALPVSAMPWVAKAINPNKEVNPCLGVNSTESARKTCLEDWQGDKDLLYYAMLAITIFGATFINSMPGYVDTIAINVVKHDPKKASYGGQRIFGSIGFTFFAFLGGIIDQVYRKPGMSGKTGTFFLYFPCCVLLVPAGCYLVGMGDWDEQVQEAPPPKNTSNPTPSNTASGVEKQGRLTTWWQSSISRRVLHIFKRFDVSFFMLTVFIHGISNSLFLGFSIMFAEDQFEDLNEAQKTYISIAGSFSEILVFPFSSLLIKKLRGTSNCIILGTASYVIRFLGMTYFRKYWIIVLLQTLHGLGFALTWAAMMEYTYEISPSDIVDTMLGILSGIFFSFAQLIANLFGSRIYQQKGGKFLFKWIGYLCAVWTVIMSLYYGMKAYRKRRDNNDANTVTFSKAGTHHQKATVAGFVNPGADIIGDEPAEDRLEC